MKKIIIITAISIIAISAHAQRTSREQGRHEPVKRKSETAERRSAEQKKSSGSLHATRTKQVTSRDISGANSTRLINGQGPNQYRENIQHAKGYKSPQNTPVRSLDNTGRYNNHRPPVETSTARSNNGYRTDTERKHYTTPNRRAVRTNHVKGYHYNPVRYRQVNYHYRVPNRIHVTWTHSMYHDYRIMYPEFGYWYYPIGYRIVTIPAYHAYYHLGEVRNVYGRVHEVYYSWATDEYHLYFGGNYPYHDFTVIIPGNHARKFARYPELYFEGRYIWVTGLLSTFEGRPELIVRRKSQVHLY